MTSLLSKPFSRFRFGLRAFFALVTALCLCLSFVVHRAEKQRRAVQAIEAMGGTVWYEDEPIYALNLLRRAKIKQLDDHHDQITRHYLHAVTEVRLEDAAINDETLRQISSLTTIKVLELDRTNVTDEGMSLVSSLPELRSLSLANTKITDAGLVWLKNAQQLRTLQLSYTAVTDQGMEQVKQLPHLQFVFLRGSKVSQSGADALISAIPALAETGVW
jgi:hypothetical protein